MFDLINSTLAGGVYENILHHIKLNGTVREKGLPIRRQEKIQKRIGIGYTQSPAPDGRMEADLRSVALHMEGRRSTTTIFKNRFYGLGCDRCPGRMVGCG